MIHRDAKVGGCSRLMPDRPLPPYSYVSGRFPHPTRDENGHSFGVAEPQFVIGHINEWRQWKPYLWGIDLFNNGYYWEAHENWELVWQAAGRKGAIAEFCQALIKLAAAGVKAREGRTAGVRKHAQRSLELLESVRSRLGSQQPIFLGLSLPQLMLAAQMLDDDPDKIIDLSEDPVVIVMPFSMQIDTDSTATVAPHETQRQDR